jgi:hypothetical protein
MPGALEPASPEQSLSCESDLANRETGCTENEVQRCDSKGKRHNSAPGNTHIQILSSDVVDLRALTAVYGSGLCLVLRCVALSVTRTVIALDNQTALLKVASDTKCQDVDMALGT